MALTITIPILCKEGIEFNPRKGGIKVIYLSITEVSLQYYMHLELKVIS